MQVLQKAILKIRQSHILGYGKTKWQIDSLFVKTSVKSVRDKQINNSPITYSLLFFNYFKVLILFVFEMYMNGNIY